MGKVSLKDIHKSFGKTPVIKGLSLEIDEGEFVVFVGPSGCGKSTMLRIIAGLEDQTAGAVEIADRRVDHLPPSKRGIAMVFQTYALYPHLTVRGNMALGLKQAGEEKAVIDQKVGEAMGILSLEALMERKPSELSGGQRQRVAIGRAIVRDPDVFLFDEPLSNLDAALRAQVRFEIARLHRRLGATMIYVTHDQIEAMTLANRIVVMNEGLIEQIGTPEQLYRTPANLFVAGFIGSPKMNFLPATSGQGALTIDGQGDLPIDQQAPAAGTALTAGIRPDGFRIAPDTAQGLPGKVLLSEYLGGES
ncbi:MAG: sn-glycerol-3-phosphate ABC transporter ATP-binding protein UgpC, partial [Pseudomonadota bacterium]